jgi:DNA modification methylase
VVTEKGKTFASGIPVYCSYSKIVNINELTENPRNPNHHPEEQIKLLSKVIQGNGWRTPITVSTRSKFITRGHARLQSAKYLNVQEVPVDYQDYESDEQEIADMLADNRIAELSDLSVFEVKDLIEELEKAGADLDLTGYDEQALETLRAAFDGDIPETTAQDDDAPGIKNECKSKVGELYSMGNHRLLCGDATSTDHFKQLMCGKKVDMILTDPPYGVNYAGKNEMLNKFDKGNKNQREIENDDDVDYRVFFTAFLKVIEMSDYNTSYIFMSGKELHNLRIAFQDAGFYWSDYLIWAKNNHVLGRKDYNAKHEFVMYGWKDHHKFYGPSGVTVIECDKPLKNDLHPTMKPIKLLVKLIIDGSQKGHIVYDPFIGSGSTIIACEKTGRSCYGMEIDPHYVDVAIERWEKLTGQKATLINDAK